MLVHKVNSIGRRLFHSSHTISSVPTPRELRQWPATPDRWCGQIIPDEPRPVQLESNALLVEVPPHSHAPTGWALKQSDAWWEVAEDGRQLPTYIGQLRRELQVDRAALDKLGM